MSINYQGSGLQVQKSLSAIWSSDAYYKQNEKRWEGVWVYKAIDWSFGEKTLIIRPFIHKLCWKNILLINQLINIKQNQGSALLIERIT